MRIETLNTRFLITLLAQLNEAASKPNEQDRVYETSKALNITFNYRHKEILQQGNVNRGHGRDGDPQKFKALVRGLTEREIRDFCGSDVEMLLGVRPLILEEHCLTRSYDPPDEQPENERHLAAKKHRDANDALERYKNQPGGIDNLLGKVISLLWMIRSNIMHGSKNPGHPDLAEVSRGREICARWLGVVDPLFEMLLDYPSRRLAVCPPEDRHELDSLDHRGKWSTKCSVGGEVESRGGRQAFSWKYDAEPIDAQVLQSDQLPSLWPKTDAIYGQEYRRIRVPVNIDGTRKVCWIYELHP